MSRFISVLLALFLFTAPAHAAAPIKLGVLSSLTGLAHEARPLDNGMQMAVEDINKAGGVLGRPLELIIRDDKNSPTAAVQEAQRLDQQDQVTLLLGTLLDNLGQAVLNYAGQAKLPFIKPTGATDSFVWKDGNRYSFRNDASTDTLGAMLAKEAAKNPAKRWAVIAPNYEFGHAMLAAFKKHLSALRPDVIWVNEQFPAYNKLDAGSAVSLMARAKPDAVLALIFNEDLVKFNREAKRRGQLQDAFYVSTYLGWPESLGLFGKETPVGWVTNGFPYQSFQDPKLQAFVKAYEARFKEPPGATSMNGYTTVQFAAAAIARAGSVDREKITDALKGLSIETPVGKLTMRAIDHQSNYGAWIGKTAFVNDAPTIVDWSYQDAETCFPPNAYVKTHRPPNAN